MLYRILRPLITLLFKIGYKPEIEGNIPKTSGIILAGNHTSILDCLLLISTTQRSIHFLAKKELWKFPKSIIFAHMGLIPVDRQKKNPNSLKQAYHYLDNDEVVLVFPEGTTEKGRGLLPFKIGAVKMAYETQKPIIPFVITGEYKLFKKKIKIKFLPPYKVFKNDLTMENNHLRDLIEKELEV